MPERVGIGLAWPWTAYGGTMIPETWHPYRRSSDGELLGWLRPEGDAFVPVSRLGRDAGAPSDWDGAEAVLEELGLGWLAEPWRLEHEPGREERVRIVEVHADRVVLKTEDWGAVSVPSERYTLPIPAPETLRPWR